MANSFSQSVSRIDASSNEVTATVPVGDGPRAIATRGNEVWVANEFDATVMRIDAGTGHISQRLTLNGRHARSPRAARESGYRAGTLAAASHRGGTLIANDTEPTGTFDADPTQSYNSADMVYDHLVAYRAAGGAAGLTLVPGPRDGSAAADRWWQDLHLHAAQWYSVFHRRRDPAGGHPARRRARVHHRRRRHVLLPGDPRRSACMPRVQSPDTDPQPPRIAT